MIQLVQDSMERAAGRREVYGRAGVRASKARNLQMLVGGMVVEDHADHFAGRDQALDRIDESGIVLGPLMVRSPPIDVLESHSQI